MANPVTQEILPPTLGSNSNPPPLFDGTTRLYIAYLCPFAQRAWIARNYKGLQDEIKLVPIDLGDKPAWYKDVYSPATVPALEHNNVVTGESLDLLKYIDSQFEGPSLFPDDPAKKEFAEEMFAYASTFTGAGFSCLKGGSENELSAAFGKLEEALLKFSDGPFFLGQFSAVDIAYATLTERFQPLLLELKNYDITAGRPKLKSWIQELDNVDAYKQTKWDIKDFRAHIKL